MVQQAKYPTDNKTQKRRYGVHLHYVSVCAKSLSHVRLFVTPWTVPRQALLSMEVSRQELWSWLPFPLLRGIFSAQESNPHLGYLLHWQVDSLWLPPPGQTIYSL